MSILIALHRPYIAKVILIPSSSVVDVMTKKNCIPRCHQRKLSEYMDRRLLEAN